MAKSKSAQPIRSYKDLVAWQEARALVKMVYVATKSFPKEETYGLALQMRRASVSVPSNVAEGYGRGTRKDYVRFLLTARGSLYELQTQLFLAEDLGYLHAPVSQALHDQSGRCSRLLHGLIRSLPIDR